MTERVLLIDDDHHVSELLLSQFAAAGVHVEVARDGLLAIEKL